MPTNTVRVIANPYSFLDHKGRPAGTVLRIGDVDYVDDSQPRQHVGAKLSATQVSKAVSVRVKGKVHTARPAVHDRTWTHSIEPVAIDISSLVVRAYYRRHVNDGSLFAADVESWVALGNDKATFVDPITLLAEAKVFAIANHVANHGEDAVPKETHAHWGEHLDARVKEIADKRQADADATAAFLKAQQAAKGSPASPAASVAAPASPSSASAAAPAPSKSTGPASPATAKAAVEA